MKKIILLASALSLLAAPVLAQDMDDTDAPPVAAAPDDSQPAPPMAGPQDGPRDHMRPDGRGWRGGPGMMMRPGGGMPFPPTKGAVFVFDRGGPGGRIIVKCADEDSTQACVQAVTPLIQQQMDMLSKMPPPPPPHGKPGPKGAPPAPPAPPAP